MNGGGGGGGGGRRWWLVQAAATSTARYPEPGTINASTRKHFQDTWERSSDRIGRSGGTRLGYIVSSVVGGRGARRFYMGTARAFVVCSVSTGAPPSTRNSDTPWRRRADDGAPSVRLVEAIAPYLLEKLM